MIKAVRVSDRNRDLSYANTPRVAESSPRQRVPFDPNYCQVGVGVPPDDVAACRSAICKRDLHGVPLLDYVAVGQHKSVRREHDAGAAAAADFETDDSRCHRVNRTDHSV